ncbi:MAG: efflux RND transporter permease subunit [Gemmatimonadota bacterium]|nr:efflux RND transporter permease subunit [Gemmatimonadota bacterium]MDH3367476.1 efflux RND transporter permease subunit [Gemmatimonadota bacterium]MDH3478189.1 efflux RND transporter permease subunit [Gemmatimonadota bacterium]
MIRLSIRRPVAVSMAYVAVALLGVAAWRNIPIELLPDTELPKLFVTAEWRGASPEATEAFVTAPLEAAVQQVRGVEKVKSTSSEQWGTAQARIEVEFARGTDMDFARLDLSERLAAMDDALPAEVRQPRIEPYVPEEFRQQQRAFLSYTLTGPYTLEALRAHVDDELVPELQLVDGIAGIEVSGGRDRLVEIGLDERKVNALGLDPGRVWQKIMELEAVSEAGVVRTGGMLRTLAIRHRTGSADEIRAAPLLTDRGRIVRVRDVATVHDTYEEPTNYYRIDGQPAVSFELHKEVGVNTVEVADRAKERLARLESAHPTGVRVILDEDESEAIRTQLTDLRVRALIAAAVIFVVLLVFLRSFRSAGIVFATIAFSVLIALNLIYFSGFTLNVLTLMGLAMGFGLIVDNAIVVLENIYRKVRAGDRGRGAAEGGETDESGRVGVSSTEEAAATGAQQVVLPILAATLTTVIVFIPFVYLQGELRVYYVPLAIVVGMSLVASLFVAFTFIPALAAKVLSPKRRARVGGSGKEEAGGVPQGMIAARTPAYVRFYSGLLGVTLRFPILTVLAAGLVLAGSWHLFNKYVTRDVLWRFWSAQQTYIEVIIRLPRGAELERTDELARYFETKLRGTPELERFVTRVWPQFARITVTFPDSLENTWVPVAIKEQMVAHSNLFGGTEVRVYGYGPSFYGGGGGAPNYSIKILGYNYETVRSIAEDLGRRLTRFSRIREVDVNSAGGWFTRDKASEFVLRLDRERLGLHGLTAQDVVYQVAAAVWGQVRRGNIRIAGEEVRFDVKIEGNEEVDVLALQELLIQTPAGQGVRLADVAVSEEREVLTRIERENQQYRRYVSYEFRGPTKLGDRTRDAVIGATRLPEGYEIEGEQEWDWSSDEQRQIWTVLAVALALVFMVTAALFESLWRQPLCVLLAVPMALVGVFLAFFYSRASFSREAYVGVIMMGGIVVNNAILLVDHINRLRRVEGRPFREAIVQGTLERVRPILMTSTTTILGLLPLVLGSEYADENIWNALAYALIGGLASSTFFVLTVTPALYLVLERGPEKRRVRTLELATVSS